MQPKSSLSPCVGHEGEEKLEDHTVVDFGGMAILKGHAAAYLAGTASRISRAPTH